MCHILVKFDRCHCHVTDNIRKWYFSLNCIILNCLTLYQIYYRWCVLMNYRVWCSKNNSDCSTLFYCDEIKSSIFWQEHLTQCQSMSGKNFVIKIDSYQSLSQNFSSVLWISVESVSHHLCIDLVNAHRGPPYKILEQLCKLISMVISYILTYIYLFNRCTQLHMDGKMFHCHMLIESVK